MFLSRPVRQVVARKDRVGAVALGDRQVRGRGRYDLEHDAARIVDDVHDSQRQRREILHGELPRAGGKGHDRERVSDGGYEGVDQADVEGPAGGGGSAHGELVELRAGGESAELDAERAAPTVHIVSAQTQAVRRQSRGHRPCGRGIYTSRDAAGQTTFQRTALDQGRAEERQRPAVQAGRAGRLCVGQAEVREADRPGLRLH